MMTTLKVIAFVLLVLWCATCPAATRGDAVGEAERIEDLRLLHYYGIAEVHKAKALAIYLQGWGGPDRRGDVETLMQEAEDVYGALVAADRGAQALLVGLEAGGDAAPSEGQLELVRRARCSAASEVRAFYQRCRALRDELAREVNQVAIQKVKWQVVSRPEPWNDPAREADRAAGHQRGCNMRDGFFEEPAEVTDYAFTKFAKAGLSYCLTGYDPACNWGRIETAPGAYDFSKLDAMLDRLTRGGLRTCLMLNTLCGDPPAWHRERHGDECTLAAPANAQAGKPAVRRGINLFHKETGDAFARFLTAYAAHLKERSAAQVDAIFVQSIQGWEQSEIEAPVHESQAMDAFWKEWSKTDVPWRTPESILKDEHPGEAAVARAEMCREAWLHEYVRRVTAALKQGWPGVRVQSLTVNDDFHRLMNTAYTGRSHNARELCGLTDNPSSAASSPASLSLYRSLAGGRWLWSWGTHSGGGTTAGADFAHQPFFDVSRISFFSALGHLVRMRYPANWYRYQDGQLGGFGLGSYAMTHRRVQEFGPVLLNTAIPRADVAILWSQSTRRRDRSRHLLRETLGWGHLLKRTNVHYDYVAEDDLAATLPGCKLLILPNAQSLPAAACDAIRAWVQEGGIVLGSGAPGLYDEFGTRRDSLPLADVFGADVARMRVPAPITPDKLETSHPEGAYCPKPPVDYKFKADLTAALKPLTGKPWACFAATENDVAIVENAFGKGGRCSPASRSATNTGSPPPTRWRSASRTSAHATTTTSRCATRSGS